MPNRKQKKLNKHIHFVISDEEKKFLTKESDKRGLSLGAFFRNAAYQTIHREQKNLSE